MIESCICTLIMDGSANFSDAVMESRAQCTFLALCREQYCNSIFRGFFSLKPLETVSFTAEVSQLCFIPGVILFQKALRKVFSYQLIFMVLCSSRSNKMAHIPKIFHLGWKTSIPGKMLKIAQRMWIMVMEYPCLRYCFWAAISFFIDLDKWLQFCVM